MLEDKYKWIEESQYLDDLGYLTDMLKEFCEKSGLYEFENNFSETINERFALYLYTMQLGDDDKDFSYQDGIDQAHVKELLYSFRFRDLSKESLIRDCGKNVAMQQFCHNVDPHCLSTLPQLRYFSFNEESSL